jgi:rhodanese-related sulfurtransferase
MTYPISHPALLEAPDGGVAEVDAVTLKTWLAQERAILIDVREHEEHAEEHIPGAELAPLSSFDPQDLPRHWRDKVAVLHCLVGSRSQKAGKLLVAAGFPNVAHLKDGILGWIAAGGDVTSAG